MHSGQCTAMLVGLCDLSFSYWVTHFLYYITSLLHTHLQEQYIFIHDAILESVTCGDTQIVAGSMRMAMCKLQGRAQSGGSGYQQLFSVRICAVHVCKH